MRQEKRVERPQLIRLERNLAHQEGEGMLLTGEVAPGRDAHAGLRRESRRQPRDMTGPEERSGSGNRTRAERGAPEKARERHPSAWDTLKATAESRARRRNTRNTRQDRTRRDEQESTPQTTGHTYPDRAQRKGGCTCPSSATQGSTQPKPRWVLSGNPAWRRAQHFLILDGVKREEPRERRPSESTRGLNRGQEKPPSPRKTRPKEPEQTPEEAATKKQP